MLETPLDQFRSSASLESFIESGDAISSRIGRHSRMSPSKTQAMGIRQVTDRSGNSGRVVETRGVLTTVMERGEVQRNAVLEDACPPQWLAIGAAVAPGDLTCSDCAARRQAPSTRKCCAVAGSCRREADRRN